MRNAFGSRNIGAFTFIELLVVILVVFVLAAMIGIPTDGIKKAKIVVCINNLKQSVIGSMMFAGDHGDHYPWQTSISSGGSLELVNEGRTFLHWQTLSNYIKNPKLFVCPTDPLKQAATTYSGFSESNVSYFVNLDAVTNSSISILTGDRHLKSGGVVAKPGLFLATTNIAWTKELHSKTSPSGNLAFADGHVQKIRETLPSVWVAQGSATNRLQIP